MRNANDLIAELEAEAGKHRYVALIVGFEESSVPIAATDANRLQLLADAMKIGGHPLGLITADQNGSELIIRTRVFREYTGEEAQQAEFVLDKLAERMGETLFS